MTSSPGALAIGTDPVGVCHGVARPHLRRKLWSEEQAAAILRALAARVDVVIGDDEELAVVAGGGDAPTRLLEAGAQTVVVKLGPRGAELHDDRGGVTSAPGLVVPAIVDPVGAGDAFCAGFIAARPDHLDDRTALLCGNGWLLVPSLELSPPAP